MDKSARKVSIFISDLANNGEDGDMAFMVQIFPLQLQWLAAKEGDKQDSHSDECPKTVAADVVAALGETGHYRIIIAGPDRADKTSMVFQAAVTAAAMDSNVVYICTHPISRLPLPVHGMKYPEPNIMRNVDFLYFEECQELLAWLASVHAKKKLPSFIVLEDVLTYAAQLNENNIEMGLAKLCALVADSCSWISNHNETRSCSIIMTAPSRIASLDFVFSQFGFKMAQYKGPSSDDSSSHLLYQWKSGQIDVSFQRANSCLMVRDVMTSIKI